MDNLTHSLAGLSVGELIHRSLPKDGPEEEIKLRRRMIVFSSLAANNFPDLDIILNPLLPAPINYLLLHRGHTHTLIYAPLQALIVFALIWFLRPAMRDLLKKDASARLGLGMALGMGFLLHFTFDYFNSYGIHPFYPFDSRWFYGDMVFIIEPVLWVILGSVYFFGLENKWAKWIGLFTLFGLPLYFTLAGFLFPSFYAFLLLIGGMLIGLEVWRKGRRRSVAFSLFMGLVFVFTQSLLSKYSKEKVSQIILQDHPEHQILDVAITPFPANPFCWSFHALSTDQTKSAYFLQVGMIAPFSDVVDVKDCPTKLNGNHVQKFSGEVAWYEAYEGSVAELRRLARENCYVSAWLQFARMPLIDGDQMVDVRFSRGGVRHNFTTLNYRELAQKECPGWLPGWVPPREDLLN